MILKKCQYHEEFNRDVNEGKAGNDYPIIWKAIVDDPKATGQQVLALARAATVGPKFDKVHKIGNTYSVHEQGNSAVLLAEDDDAICDKVSCVLTEENQDGAIFRIEAHFGVPSTEGELNFLPPPDPLKWPIQQWIEIEDEEGVVETAHCLTALTHLLRGYEAGGPPREPGPVVNAAGQQTVDPLKKTVRRTILCTLVNYPSALYAVALNLQFGDTVHCELELLETRELLWVPEDPPGPETPYLMGCPHFTWKFLGAEADKKHHRNIVTGGEGEEEEEELTVPYCPTTVKIEFKLGEKVFDAELDIPDEGRFFWQGWIHKMLNNGQTTFRKWKSAHTNPATEQWIMDSRFPNPHLQNVGTKMLLPTTALQVKEDFDLGEEDPRTTPTTLRPQPTRDDMEEVETSEPINLHLSGVQMNDPTNKAVHIYYLDLKPANYYDITDNFGVPIFPEEVTLPTFPLPTPP